MTSTAPLARFASETDFADALQAFLDAHPPFRSLVAACGAPTCDLRPAGFAALLYIVVTQQLSTAAARSIWKRMTAMGLDDPQRLAAGDDRELRRCGLSAAKIACARALAAADLDYEGMKEQGDEARRRLLAVKGIGPWSADIFAMFCLGQVDAFAPGDLALREGMRMALSLPERPSIAEAERLAEPWRPHRSVAARLLWRHYRRLKNIGGAGANPEW